MIEKEFTQEQLEILANLVLSEMGNLREFGNGRPSAIRKALEKEIVCLHTLYNYLIS
jgi:hypothetical protein